MAEIREHDDRTLPAGWVWASIGEITQPVEKVYPTGNPDTEFTYLDISSIDNTVNRITQPKFYRGADAPSRARQLVRANDVLFSTVRTYLKNIALVPEAYDEQIASTGFAVLRAKDGVVPKYLFYFCLTDDFLSELGKLQRGTSYPAVRDSDVREQPIPLAPLAEQHRIVDEIEKYFTCLDAGLTALKRAQANLQRYKAAVLKAACEGRLVPTEAELARAEGRDYEPAPQLLQRILAERRTMWEAENPGKRYKQPAQPDTSALPELPELAEGWVWTTAEQLSDPTRSITYGVIKLGEPVEHGIPTLRSSDVRHLHLDLSEVKRISPEIASDYKRTFLQGGEVLITVRGTLGGVVVVPKECHGFNISREVAMIALVEQSVGPAVAFFLGSKPVQSWLLQRTRGIAYIGINIATLKQTPLPLPPLAEQHRIVEEVERRLSVVQELEAAVEANLKRAERLRQAILKRAFEGKLVPQDPAEEPASVLLERIRGECVKEVSGGKHHKVDQLRLPEL